MRKMSCADCGVVVCAFCVEEKLRTSSPRTHKLNCNMPFEFRPAYSLLTDTALRVQMLLLTVYPYLFYQLDLLRVSSQLLK